MGLRPTLRAALASVFLLCAGPAAAWTQAAHERIALLAVRLMPPALQYQLLKNREALIAGVREPDLRSEPRSHSLHSDGSEGTLDRDVEREVEESVELVRSLGNFADLAQHLGRISHLAADAAFPLNTSASEPREELFYADYAGYAVSKMAKFPEIFNGYGPVQGDFAPGRFLHKVAERANQMYPIVARGYFPDGSGAMRSSRSFDDRGPVFGVTQLSFISAVSATANLWLYAWREAHGDLTGTPHYSAARGDQGAPSRSRVAQRP